MPAFRVLGLDLLVHVCHLNKQYMHNAITHLPHSPSLSATQEGCLLSGREAWVVSANFLRLHSPQQGSHS